MDKNSDFYWDDDTDLPDKLKKKVRRKVDLFHTLSDKQESNNSAWKEARSRNSSAGNYTLYQNRASTPHTTSGEKSSILCS